MTKVFPLVATQYEHTVTQLEKNTWSHWVWLKYIEEMILPEVSKQLVGSRPSPHMRLVRFHVISYRFVVDKLALKAIFLRVFLISCVSNISSTL